MRKIKFFCDPLVTAMGSVWTLFVIPFSWAILIYATFIYEKNSIDTLSDKIIVAGFYLMEIFAVVISLRCVPQWFGYIKLDSQGVTWCAPFSKKICFSYDDFTFVRIAYYTHIYEKRFFLVLSRRYLSPTQLMNVNQLRSDETLVKIKITKRRFRVLSEILPDTLSCSLVGAWNGDFSKGGFNVDAEMKRQAQRRRQKRKRKKR